MVAEAAILVVDDEQEGVVPERAAADCAVDLADEGFTLVDGEVGMLAVGDAVVDGLDEAVLRDVVVFAVVEEASDVKEPGIGEHDRGLAGVDAICRVEIDGVLVDVFEDGECGEGSFDGVLGERAAGRGGMG